MYDLLVYIGRFQPFHAGHLHVVEEAAKISKNILILMGSYGSRTNFNNPFNDIERAEIIHKSVRRACRTSPPAGVWREHPPTASAPRDRGYAGSLHAKRDRRND